LHYSVKLTAAAFSRPRSQILFSFAVLQAEIFAGLRERRGDVSDVLN
jgi:hypothetical protein